MNINEIIASIKQLESDKTILIAIEGFGGSGKSSLAEKLKEQLPNSEVVKIDSFIIKEKAQNAASWEEVFDRVRLEEQVLKPASAGQAVSYQRLNWVTNTLGRSIELPSLKYLIVDGITSYHPEIAHYYDFKIWVNTPIEIAKERGRLRDRDNENAKMWDKWAARDIEYQEKYHPEQKADFTIDNGKES